MGGGRAGGTARERGITESLESRFTNEQRSIQLEGEAKTEREERKEEKNVSALGKLGEKTSEHVEDDDDADDEDDDGHDDEQK